MIPQQIQSVTENTSIEIVTQPSKTHKDVETLVMGKIDGLQAVMQTVRHILNKERYAYVGYPDWFGIELEKYKGQSFQYLQAQIEKDLKEALLEDDRIYEVTVTKIEQTDIDSAYVEFYVYCNYGTFKESVSVNV